LGWLSCEREDLAKGGASGGCQDMLWCLRVWWLKLPLDLPLDLPLWRETNISTHTLAGIFIAIDRYNDEFDVTEVDPFHRETSTAARNLDRSFGVEGISQVSE